MAVVTVVVPVYNVKPYLKQCLDSLLAQSLKDIEIICVDDGSNDGSEKILDQYSEQDPRFRVIHKKNSGYGNTMNIGIKAASGDYIGIVESDDFVSDIMYEKLYQIAVTYRADVVKSNYYLYKESYKKPMVLEALANCKYECGFRPIDDPAIFDVQPSIWSGLYKRELLQQPEICFLETPGASYQDTSFIFKVWLNAQNVYLLKEAFLYYRCDNPDASVCSKEKAFYICDEFKEIERYLFSKKLENPLIISVMLERKFKAYEWNYKRLDGKLKEVFFKKMKEEFEYSIKMGFLCNDVYIREMNSWREER